MQKRSKWWWRAPEIGFQVSHHLSAAMQIFDKPQFIIDGTEAIDIIQGRLGDCRRFVRRLISHFHLFDVNYWFSYTILTSATNRLMCMAARVSGLWSFGIPGEPLNGRALGESRRMARCIECLEMIESLWWKLECRFFEKIQLVFLSFQDFDFLVTFKVIEHTAI